jgi:hypothetical protein
VKSLRLPASLPGVLAALLGFASLATGAAPPAAVLKPAAEFADIANRRARALALFQEMGKVLQHPRCLNCHPAGESPTQTEAMRAHQPLVVRGAGGRGAAGLHCMACHHEQNFDIARVPGDPKWALAPASMAWQGKSLAQICTQLKDRRRNGGKDLAALQAHMAHDELVGWGWHPGADRVPAPGTQAIFGDLVTAWIEAGASCPRG